MVFGELFNVIQFFVFVFFEAGSLHVDQAGLEVLILLPQPSECWDYRCTPPHLA
jgi:hypothetical protein